MDDIFNNIKRYNYWNNNSISSGFEREFYLSKIREFTGNKLIKVMIGQRRVGKSYIMRQVIQSLVNQKVNPDNILYLNKEWVELDEIADYKDLKELIKKYERELKPKGKIYIFLDEIQEIEGWEKTVNSFSQDHTKEYELFITGSNSGLFSGELATRLTGRYISFEILPFTFVEYISVKKLKKNKESFLKYMQTGGLPEFFNLKSEETKLHYISSLKDSILLKDIVLRYNIKDVFLLERIFRYLSQNIGNITSIGNIITVMSMQNLKTNYETIANYIDHLKSSLLIHELERMELKAKEVLKGNKKYYLNDLSFRNLLFPTFEFGLGQLLENAIFLHYKSLGYKIYAGSGRQFEIDFVLQKKDEQKYVQVAYLLSDNNVIEREFGNLKRIKDNFEKIVITLDDIPLGNKEGIKHFCAWNL